MMRCFFSIFIGFVVFGMAAVTKAQPIDGFVSPAYTFTKQMGAPANAVSTATNASATTSETAQRTRLELQFARIQKNVEVDLSLGSGGGYSDYGAILRFYNHFPLMGDKTATGVSLGAGLGLHQSSEGIWAATATGSEQRKFSELILAPFARFLYDFGMGVGVAAEMGLELVPQRYFSSGDPSSDSSFRKRLFYGVTLVLSSRWME